MSANDGSRTRARRALAAAALSAALGFVAFAPPAGADWLRELVPESTTTAAPTQVRAAWRICLFGRCWPPTTTSTTTTTAPSTTTTAPETECLSLPKASGGTWDCTFSDEFDGTSLDRTKWYPHMSSPRSHDSGLECFVDSPDNIAVADGTLQLTVRELDEPIDCAGRSGWRYTSGMVSTYPGPGTGHAQAYGRFEIRARVTGAKQQGLQESFWMWPENPIGVWPASGEIDIAEIFHRYPDRAIPYVHYGNVLDRNVTNNYCLIDDISRFHTYVLEWTPQSIKILYDGKVCIDDPWKASIFPSNRRPFDKPFYLILTQALGIGNNAFQPGITPLPASTIVDYVRIWE